MGKVIYSMFVSLDGFIDGPNKELDWHILLRYQPDRKEPK